MSNSKNDIKFTGRMLTFTRLQLDTNDLEKINTHLASVLNGKDSQMPVIIDSSQPQNLKELSELLWSWGLQPIGVVTGELNEQAKEQRLAIFPADGKRIKNIDPTTTNTASDKQKIKPKQSDTPTEKDASNNATISSATSLVYEQMLRSGQSLNHVGGDLVLTQGINDGAEAITDNNLHIYGNGQGRLVAGATGDQNAHIFCQRFNPSLVSVAGTYCLRDGIPEEVIDQPVQVSYVEGEGLVFQIMDD